MKKSFLGSCAAVSATVRALAGGAPAPGTGGEPASGGDTSASAASDDFKACMVSDSGGFDDKSFNQTSYKGLTDAKKKLGIPTGEVESATTADFAKNIQSMVDAKCSIIVTVGFLLADDTLAAAKKNPDIDFAIVDANDKKFEGVKNL
ncbi:MAG: BMP family ABC transporter substrate-binding protein, partial [Microlunatus sp.]|nr:BMP family ABC transporter substrate-binding protein [Microlunatus sp.]